VTVFAGDWQAVAPTAADGNIKITGATTGATVAGVGGDLSTAALASLKASGTAPSITQGEASNSALVIAASTTIDLGGTASAALGSITLAKAASNVGSISFGDVTSFVKAGTTEGTALSAGTTTIGGAAVDFTTIDASKIWADSTKVTKIGGAAGSIKVGGSTDDVVIDSTAVVVVT
jgi:hypothetical protein